MKQEFAEETKWCCYRQIPLRHEEHIFYVAVNLRYQLEFSTTKIRKV